MRILILRRNLFNFVFLPRIWVGIILVNFYLIKTYVHKSRIIFLWFQHQHKCCLVKIPPRLLRLKLFKGSLSYLKLTDGGAEHKSICHKSRQFFSIVKGYTQFYKQTVPCSDAISSIMVKLEWQKMPTCKCDVGA